MRGLAAAAALLLATGCGEETVSGDPAVERGRGVYLSICTACHNADPTREGSQGPPVAGASLELLEARVLRREYPPGYTPQRTSDLMPAFPQLADHLGDLHAFLAAAADSTR
ncbi:MAG: cytochrome c [Myxococcota bacterium]